MFGRNTRDICGRTPHAVAHYNLVASARNEEVERREQVGNTTQWLMIVVSTEEVACINALGGHECTLAQVVDQASKTRRDCWDRMRISDPGALMKNCTLDGQPRGAVQRIANFSASYRADEKNFSSATFVMDGRGGPSFPSWRHLAGRSAYLTYVRKVPLAIMPHLGSDGPFLGM